MPENEAPSTPRKRRSRPQPVITPKPRRRRKSGAAAEIDKQLQDALRERAIVSKKLSEMAGLQDRYRRLSQEINELLNTQARINGLPVMPTAPLIEGGGGPASMTTTSPNVPIPFVAGAPIPPTIGSIPSNPRNPTPNPGGNVASEITEDRDFS